MPPDSIGGSTGYYWTAVRPANYVEDDEEDFTVEGTHLRLMWDHGGPLWSDVESLLPDEPRWLREALGLSEALIVDLLQWQADMDELPVSRKSLDPLHERAEALVERLRAEIGDRFAIEFRP